MNRIRLSLTAIVILVASVGFGQHPEKPIFGYEPDWQNQVIAVIETNGDGGVHDATTGGTLVRIKGPVSAIRLSPSGTQVAVTVCDKTSVYVIRIYDLLNGHKPRIVNFVLGIIHRDSQLAWESEDSLLFCGYTGTSEAPIANIWRYRVSNSTLEQVTSFRDIDGAVDPETGSLGLVFVGTADRLLSVEDSQAPLCGIWYRGGKDELIGSSGAKRWPRLSMFAKKITFVDLQPDPVSGLTEPLVVVKGIRLKDPPVYYAGHSACFSPGGQWVAISQEGKINFFPTGYRFPKLWL